MGDDVALLGMVLQPAHVLDELAAVIDQGIVNGNDAVGQGNRLIFRGDRQVLTGMLCQSRFV